ncbi:MAG: Threonine synthase [Planctomycetes bacterium]|nr:Threonine synthase [Planctomycetota bacterium]HRJ79388.1 threonine synthase [Planctomycetota bacterium]
MKKSSGVKPQVSHFKKLTCSGCSKAYPHNRPQTVCQTCGAPLLAEYDTRAIGASVKREDLRGRPASIWRYRDFLPLPPTLDPVTLHEGFTPLVRLGREPRRLKLDELWLKDESKNPGFTFKARGMSVAVSKAVELKLERLALRSAGNAAAPFAAYTARAGLRSLIAMPKDAPELTLLACEMLGARVSLQRGSLEDCTQFVQTAALKDGYFDLSSFAEPYRLEGDKTLGMELAEDFNWELPDWVIYPGDGGMGLIGMWKAWRELEEAGFIGKKRPKLLFVQGEGCAGIVKAFQSGEDRAETVTTPTGVAAGLRVGKTLGDNLILRALHESGGAAIAVPDSAIINAMKDLARSEGILAAPEGAASLAGLRRALEQGLIKRSERIVLVNTNTGLKYANLVR